MKASKREKMKVAEILEEKEASTSQRKMTAPCTMVVSSVFAADIPPA
jgi:hypothetical protein